jgi:Tol biopolymer transport system component/C-terminal processing protease CtpA/Prc
VERFKRLFIFILAPALALAKIAAGSTTQSPVASSAAREALPYFSEPAISPDRSEIAFVSGGDIWTAPVNGGEARLLVSHAAMESRPLYSPDGKKLAFVSTRTGNGDIYVLTLDTGELRRVTFDEASEQLDAWSRDGRWLYFSSTGHDIAGMNDIYRVSAEGGTPMQVSADRYVNEFWAAPSPDGNQLAFTARGIASSQWWRKGHSHLDECEIWLMRDTTPPAYEQLSDSGGKNMWPMWGGDGRTVYYVSDRNGAQNIWSRVQGAQAKPITRFKDGRVLWPNISYDGRVIVFERDFSIWKLDTSNNQASEIKIARRGLPAGPATERLTLTSQVQEMELSPDGKKVAFITHGEIFAASAKDGGDAVRITSTVAVESQINWSPDSRRIVYVSNREGTPHLFTYDFTTNTETQLTSGAAAETTPRHSPDGKQLAFVLDARELRLLDLQSKQERAVATGSFERQPFIGERPFAWSPDGRWLAFLSLSGKLFRNVQVIPSAGGEARPVSFLANAQGGSVTWSPDGTFLLFDTGQRTEEFRVARVDLVPRTPRFREDLFRDLFKEEAPRTPNRAPQETRPANAEPPREPSVASTTTDEKKSTKPVEVVFDDIRRRLQLLPIGVDVDSQTVSPDGKTLLVIADSAGQRNLYTYSLDELSKEPPVARQLTSTAGFKRSAQFTPDGKEVFFIEQGRINVVAIESRQVRPLAVTAEMDVDFAREKMEAFRQAWTYLRDNFYDPNFHGVNWEAVRVAYEPRINGARTPEEMRRLLNLMVGELNASHSGVGGPFSAAQVTPSGRLGLTFDRAEYEANGQLRVTNVLPLSPAALAGIKPGEYLLSVDGAATGAHVNLDELLSFKINRRVALAIAATGDGTGRREVAVRPVSLGTEKGLLYRNWVEEQRAYVARISKGRLGYVHMVDMGEASLAQLYVDLDVENHSREGVIIDVRNNNGGFVNAYALDVFARRPYLTMTPRGLPSTPARTALGQRALEAPTILVTNQHSLSDAEDFTEGYRALKLGKVVGEPTAGWIIYTSGTNLIDGSSLRIPFIKITSSDGALMELNPRPVDVTVTRPIGEGLTGRDSQLDAAVRELLKQIDQGSRRQEAGGSRQ